MSHYLANKEARESRAIRVSAIRVKNLSHTTVDDLGNFEAEILNVVLSWHRHPLLQLTGREQVNLAASRTGFN